MPVEKLYSGNRKLPIDIYHTVFVNCQRQHPIYICILRQERLMAELYTKLGYSISFDMGILFSNKVVL